jgi:hypothetical protein|nr:MAG TPA: hypothetical protein [Bacteriophage sp.]
MINVMDLLVVLNSIILLGVCVVYFRKNYVIMDMDSYNTIVDYVEQTKNKEDEVPELEGGTGFFREYIENEDDEDEE